MKRKTWQALAAAGLSAVLLFGSAGCISSIKQNSPSKSPTPTVAGSPGTTATQAPVVTPTANPNFRKVAMTVDGVDLTVSEYNYYYFMALNNYMQSTYNMGADMTKSLKDQKVTMITGVDANTTVHDYLDGQAMDMIKKVITMSNAAKKAGITLDETDKASMQQTYDQIASEAAGKGVSSDDYIASIFGYGADLAMFKVNNERNTLASKYLQKYMSDLKLTDAQIEAEYAKQAAALDLTDYRIFTFDGQATDVDANATDAEKTAANEKAMAAAKAKADAMKAKIKTEADFIAQANANKPADNPAFDGDKNTLFKSAKPDSMAAEVAAFLYDKTRKAYDVAVVKGATDYSVVMFLKRYRNTGVYSVDVRHILFKFDATKVDANNQPTQANKDATKAKAQKILDQYKKGPLTEDNFAKLATANTEDTGSKATGGLYKDITQTTSFVQSFLDWCFAPGRKVGDTGIIESEYGYHIMFMSKINEPYWKVAVENTLRQTAASDHMEKTAAAAKVTVNDFDRSFVDWLIQKPEPTPTPAPTATAAPTS